MRVYKGQKFLFTILKRSGFSTFLWLRFTFCSWLTELRTYRYRQVGCSKFSGFDFFCCQCHWNWTWRPASVPSQLRLAHFWLWACWSDFPVCILIWARSTVTVCCHCFHLHWRDSDAVLQLLLWQRVDSQLLECCLSREREFLIWQDCLFDHFC